jgi:hypothetical protein
LQEDRIGSILKKTLKIDINPDFLAGKTKNNFGFLDENYGFEEEEADLSSKRKYSPSPLRQPLFNLQKPAKTQYQPIQYSFNQFVPLEFPREREIKEKQSTIGIYYTSKRRQLQSRSIM